MTFMESQSCSGPYWEIETRDGTTFLPAEICGTPDLWACTESVPDSVMVSLDDIEYENESASIRDCFADYAEYILEVTYHAEGTLYRLSAPGYLDCTEWSTEPPDDEG